MSFEEEMIEWLKAINRNLDDLKEILTDKFWDDYDCPNEFNASSYCKFCHYRSQCRTDENILKKVNDADKD